MKPARRFAARLLALAALPAGAALAADAVAPPNPFALPLGAPVAALPVAGLMGFACGTGGGPPSLPLGGWADFARCPAEPQSGLHEVYFRNDDEAEYRARALDLQQRIALLQGTTVYEHPVVESGLIDDAGRLRAVRIVSDAKAPLEMRSKAAALRNFIMSRYDTDGWQCTELPHETGETPFLAIFIKQDCVKDLPDRNLHLLLRTRHFRKPGQTGVDPRTQELTEGQFTSSVWFEMQALDPAKAPDAAPQAGDAEARIAPAGPAEAAFLAGTARDCPGCRLAGAQLKRHDLSGADLSGADLGGANLHDADLAGADLSGADLTEADLNKANLTRTRFAGARMARVMLYAARLDGADLSGADLSEAMLGEARLTRAQLPEANFTDADLRRARFVEAGLAGANFTSAWLDGAQFDRADLSAAVLSRAVSVGAVFKGANFTGAVAQATDFLQSDLTDADFSGADLSGSRLLYAVPIRTRLDSATLTGTIMPDGSVHP